MTGRGLLRDRDATALRAAGRVQQLSARTTLFRQGDRAGFVAHLLRGHVKLSRLDARGEETVLAVHGPDALLGEVAAIDGLPREVTTTALNDVEFVVVEAGAFLQFVEARPGVAFGLLRQLTQRVRQTDQARVEGAGRSTLQRVAARLLELTERFGPEDGDVVVPLEQGELASWVGSSRESVNRALAVLRRRELVTTGRGRILVLDPHGLHDLVA